MRNTSLTLLTLVATATWATSQTTPAIQTQPQPATPAAPAPLDPAGNPLDGYLLRWEQSMKKIDSLALACTRTETDKVYQTRRVYEGTIHYLRPNMFFWNMKVKDKPQDFERIICSGQYIYQFLPTEKQIRVYQAPQPKQGGGLADDSSIAFLFGMPAAEAKARYELKLANEDKFYVYVDVIPRREIDKADFKRARIILNKDTYLPRQLWFEHPNQGEVHWDIPTIQAGVALNKTVFAPPATPTGWKLVQGQAPTQKPQDPPRVVRPKQ